MVFKVSILLSDVTASFWGARFSSDFYMSMLLCQYCTYPCDSENL